MPFGIGKSEKEPEDEGDPTPEEDPKGGEDAPSAVHDEQVEDGDPSVAASPTDDSQTGESAPYRPMTFRPAFLDDAESGEGAQATPQPTQPPEADTFFISVSHDGGTEIHRFDDPTEARSFVEDLLEKGVPEGNVTVFSGRKLALTVSHRPIVRLVSGQGD